MPVRTLIFLILFTPLHALAMSCWMTSGADINFGNMVAGEAVSASTKVKFSCQADYGTTQYVNVCLSSTDTPPFQMMSVGDDQGKQYTLLFRIFSATDRAQELSLPTSGNLMQQTLVAASNTTVSGSFPLIATIPDGQSQLPARSYFKYNMDLRIAWHSASSQETLKSCQDGSADGEQIQGSSRAEATLTDGCFIQRVTPLNFGTLTSSATLSASRSTATLTARCPAKTAFSLGLSMGAHASGNQRQVCNNAGQCLRYGLWQDASATQSWGDQSSGNTMNVSNEQGGTQSYSIYGVVPAQPLTGTGEFSDDVVVTLTY